MFPRRLSGWLALIPLLGLTAGCFGDDKPPYSCAWIGTPGDVSVGRLAGTYTGKAADGTPVTLVLSADGRYTAENLVDKDWLSGTGIAVAPEGGWRLHVDEPEWDIPLLEEDPPHAEILFEGADLDVGGTLAAPVLYDTEQSSGTCETLPNMLRRTS